MALTKTPIELSSTPSIVDGGNATAITIDSSERVGINKTSPSEKLHIGASGADDSNAIKIDGTNGSSQTFGFILQADGENARVSFKVGQGNNTPTQKLMIHPDGGICFGTDTAAANALDDYEEGTWTMGITTSSASSISFTNTTGTYTKVGNLVTVGIYTAAMNVSNAGGGTTDITGLPFTVAAGEKSYTAASFAHTSLFATSYSAYPAINTTFVRVTQVGNILNATLAAGNPKYMMFALTYFTNA